METDGQKNVIEYYSLQEVMEYSASPRPGSDMGAAYRAYLCI